MVQMGAAVHGVSLARATLTQGHDQAVAPLQDGLHTPTCLGSHLLLAAALHQHLQRPRTCLAEGVLRPAQHQADGLLESCPPIRTCLAGHLLLAAALKQHLQRPKPGLERLGSPAKDSAKGPCRAASRYAPAWLATSCWLQPSTTYNARGTSLRPTIS